MSDPSPRPVTPSPEPPETVVTKDWRADQLAKALAAKRADLLLWLTPSDGDGPDAHTIARDILSALPSAPDHRLTGNTLRKAIAAVSDLTNPRLSEIEWDYVAAALSEPDPTYYDGRPDTPEEQRRISEALGEHRGSS